MKRLVLVLALAAVSCATATPAEFSAVEASFARVTADVVILAAENRPEYVVLRDHVKAKEWLQAFEAAVGLAARVKDSALARDVEQLKVDVRKLFTKDEAVAARELEAAVAR